MHEVNVATHTLPTRGKPSNLCMILHTFRLGRSSVPPIKIYNLLHFCLRSAATSRRQLKGQLLQSLLYHSFAGETEGVGGCPLSYLYIKSADTSYMHVGLFEQIKLPL